MLVSELCSIGSSGASKGFKQDQRNAETIKRREVRRRNEEIGEEFMEVMRDIYPEYYGGE